MGERKYNNKYILFIKITFIYNFIYSFVYGQGADSRQGHIGRLLIDLRDTYINTLSNIIQKKKIELSNSENKTCRIIERASEDTRSIPFWLGI